MRMKSETLLLLKGTQQMYILLSNTKLGTLKTLLLSCLRIYQQDIRRLVIIVVKVKTTFNS